jgi:2-desacetyl-2-hydroxyethyl bacteriochlorophyllide A dehydrogenase
MKAIVFQGINKMTLEARNIPEPGPDEVLIRVKACGICGTDPHILHGIWPGGFPLIPGHEASGEVVALGQKVKKLKIGDHIAVDPNVGCGYCEYCQRGIVHMCKNQKPFGVFSPGGFAEYATIRETHALLLPAHVSFEEGAMVEPLACCLRGSQMSAYEVGSSVLFHGAGAIGNMNMQLARVSGASVIIISEPLENRRKLALEFGADVVIDPKNQDVYAEVRRILPDGPDVIMDCTGIVKIVEDAIPQVRRGGKVVAFGVCPPDQYAKFSPAYINDNEITICGSLNNPYTSYPAIQAIASGRIQVKPLISHEFSLEQYEEAFGLFGSAGSMKILIKP